MVATTRQLAWLKTMVVPAQMSQRKWRVPTSISLAQCILESAWGQSQLSRRCNNFFGVKALPGEAYEEFPTHEVYQGRTVTEMARFARYPSAIESFEAHARLIATLHRYAPVMEAADKSDLLATTFQLRQCGYSTDPDYPQKLRTLISQLDLTQYDTNPPDQPATQEAA